MTTTDTTNLAEILSAKKAELNGQPEPPIEADVVTGEIVSAAATETPIEGGDPSPSLPVVAPAPVEVRYPEIPPKVVGGLPYVRDYMKLAKTICNTEFVPRAFMGRPDAICAAYMRGYEMGFGPMQALDSFNVIEGKVGLTAEAMRALIMQDGHDIIMSDEVGGDGSIQAVVAECHRKQWPADKWATYRYSMEDAALAGLLRSSQSGKPTAWQKFPRDMLQARATSGAGRRYFADVLAGMSYTPEEIRDFSGPDQEVTPSPPAPVPTPIAPPTDSVLPESNTTTTAEPSPAPSDSPATTTPPKRPRGRPRKAQSAPIAAPGPSAAETPTLAVVPEIVPGSNAPELTSLNDPTVAVPVIREMLRVLTLTIKSIPAAQQQDCRDFIRGHFPDGTSNLSEADVQKCIDIAAGWPDSAAQHPVPEAELPF